MSRICFILNNAPHYREEIYILIDQSFPVDFYIGDVSNASNIRRMDLSLFSKKPFTIKFKRLYKAYHWYSNSVGLVFNKNYHKYVMTGEPICISSWIILLLGKLMNKDISLWSHGFYGKEKGVKKFIKKVYYSAAKRTLLYGNHSRDIMVKLGFDPSTLLVVYNSLFYKKQLKIREQISHTKKESFFNNGLPVVIFVGRLTKDKKVQLLVEALNISLSKDRLPFNVLIVGDGSERDPIADMIFNKGLQSRVLMTGPCYDEYQLAKYFYESDLCVSPGEVGLTGIHAMSYGTPVITHNDFNNQMPEFEAIRKGMNGDFFEKDNAEDLSLTIHKWLSRYPVKAEEVKQNCFEVVNNYYNPYKQIDSFSFLNN